MANHEAVAAYPVAPATANKQLARDMAVRRMPYVVALASEVPSLVAVDPASGAAIVDIMLFGRVFTYDATDVTSVHDGTTVLVSVEGRRYKLAAGTDVVAYSVINKTTTTPPGSPTIGDAYLVAPAATGAWAGQDNNVAVFTSRGWEFIIFVVGRFIYVKDTDSYWHKNSAGVWTIGFGAQAFTANSVAVSALIGQPVQWHIINATTNAPPGSPTVGQAYIIGPAPTGSWAGNANKIAICEVAGVFTIYTPRIGETAFNLDAAVRAELRYNGTVWVSSASGYVLLQAKTVAGVANVDFLFGAGVAEYDSYEFVITGLKISTLGGQLQLQFGTGGGPTYVVTGYRNLVRGHSPLNTISDNPDDSFNVNQGVTTDSRMLLTSASTNHRLSASAGARYNATIHLDNPDDSNFPLFKVEAFYNRSADNLAIIFNATAVHLTAAVITAIRFAVTTGTMNSGLFCLYGRRKS